MRGFHKQPSLQRILHLRGSIDQVRQQTPARNRSSLECKSAIVTARRFEGPPTRKSCMTQKNSQPRAGSELTRLCGKGPSVLVARVHMPIGKQQTACLHAWIVRDPSTALSSSRVRDRISGESTMDLPSEDACGSSATRLQQALEIAPVVSRRFHSAHIEGSTGRSDNL